MTFLIIFFKKVTLFMDNTIGNISTIVKLISMWIAGWFIGVIISQGLQLPITQEQLAEIIGAIIFLIIGYIDAKYPNTFKFLGNAKLQVDPTEPVLNDEYESDNDGC